MSDHKKAPIQKSFGYAFAGIASCIKNERNMKIHCVMALLVTAAGFVLEISVTEWCICLILFALIFSLEMVNTAVESVVDLVTLEKKPLAKIAKDTAAGAVLAAAILSAIIGCVIFVPKGLTFLRIL
ncbi:MAG TPA: diacylglycerol kinase family protein [Candidatus Blautia faecigallinarum]|uniref:Diacylglycerol kinase family protein n=1 Tax=Candidatus Blautia faecigallinarum TaxID=2838488 RepID=A0A9D2IUP3_9FIRM|nr:diacylglycerol kinase family protein [Candidatus Blautia faecigallinarum]